MRFFLFYYSLCSISTQVSFSSHIALYKDTGTITVLLVLLNHTFFAFVFWTKCMIYLYFSLRHMRFVSCVHKCAMVHYFCGSIYGILRLWQNNGIQIISLISYLMRCSWQGSRTWLIYSSIDNFHTHCWFLLLFCS